MTRNPQIPMSPGEMPQQRLNPVVDLPPRPEPFHSRVGWGSVPADERPKTPARTIYLGQVEWAWSPAHSRVAAYYLHRTRKLWILWARLYDDSAGRWEWEAVGSVPLGQATDREAAVHLLLESFSEERDEGYLDHFHWINGVSFLTVEEWREIGRRVWP